MSKWTAGAFGAVVGAAIYHALRSAEENIPRLAPEVVLDGDISPKQTVFELRIDNGRLENVRKEISENPNIIPMFLRLRNVGKSEAQNVKVADVEVAGELARWTLGYDLPVINPKAISDPILPTFSGPSGLFGQDLTTKAYLQVIHESRNLGKFCAGWEKRREKLMEKAAKEGDPEIVQGWNNHSLAFYEKEITEYIESFQNTADYIEDRKYPASATYQDSRGRKYVVEWDYTFHPINHFMLWERLVMGHQDGHIGEGLRISPIGPCLTISSFRTRRL